MRKGGEKSMRNMRLLRPDDGGAGGGSGEAGDPTTPNPQSDAVVRYRELVASQPGLVPEMVRGETVEEIDASAMEARRAYSEISRRITEQFERAVPPGNPARSSADVGVERLKPESKIALGLKRIGQ
jgi:hypothetical protein